LGPEKKQHGYDRAGEGLPCAFLSDGLMPPERANAAGLGVVAAVG
jgi:hypothetical protein